MARKPQQFCLTQVWPKCTVALLACVVPMVSWGAGFAVDVHNAGAIGTSYAGIVTGMHGLSNTFGNPALFANTKQTTYAVDLGIFNYTVELSGPATATSAYAQSADARGDAGTLEEAGASFFMPSFYWAQPLSDRLTVGFEVATPFGLLTEYSKDWIGRYHAVESSIETINFGPAVGYQVNDRLSVGAGLMIQQLDVTHSTAIDFGTAVLKDSALALDGFSEITGDDIALGYRLGLSYEADESTRLGFGYRSKVTHNIKGRNTLTLPTALAASLTTAGYASSDVETQLVTPEVVKLGVLRQYGDWDVAIDGTWTRWSQFKELNLNHKNYLLDAKQSINWQNTWMWSLGGQYAYTDTLKLRMGLSFDDTAMPDSRYLTPRIPVGKRQILGAGFEYQVNPQSKIDFSLMQMWFDKAQSRLDLADPNNLAKGTFNGDFDVSLTDISLGWEHSF